MPSSAQEPLPCEIAPSVAAFPLRCAALPREPAAHPAVLRPFYLFYLLPFLNPFGFGVLSGSGALLLKPDARKPTYPTSCRISCRPEPCGPLGLRVRCALARTSNRPTAPSKSKLRSPARRFRPL